MTTIHATEDDYRDWIGAAPDAALPANITQVLRTASGLVDDATITAVYAVDDDGAPTDAAILQAMSDATCAQTAAMLAAKIDPLAGGVISSSGAVKGSKALDGASFTYADASAAAAARAQVADGLVPEAQRILARAGLSSTRVWTFG